MDTLIHHLEHKQELGIREIEAAAELLLSTTASAEKKAHLLELLAAKGETAQEIAGFVEVFLTHSQNPHLNLLELDGPTLDMCGTGGDQLNLFNVSSTAMFIAAAAGAIVVKHGNRGITSKSGGADVLEALGVKIDLPPDDFRKCIEHAGMGFLFAPLYHPAFKSVVEARKICASKKVRTIFNIIGPLLNPARPECQLVGVYARELCPTFADILARLYRDSAWVVNGTTQDGKSVDEVSLMGSTKIFKSGQYQDNEEEEISPEDFGLTTCPVSALQGGDAVENAQIIENILSGKDRGAKADMALLNAACAIACCGLSDHISDGLEIARETINDGSAFEKLQLLKKHSNS